MAHPPCGTAQILLKRGCAATSLCCAPSAGDSQVARSRHHHSHWLWQWDDGASFGSPPQGRMRTVGTSRRRRRRTHLGVFQRHNLCSRPEHVENCSRFRPPFTRRRRWSSPQPPSPLVPSPPPPSPRLATPRASPRLATSHHASARLATPHLSGRACMAPCDRIRMIRGGILAYSASYARGCASLDAVVAWCGARALRPRKRTKHALSTPGG
jgi:hypothetical protein